jgi:GNAT superfamily N-acetyltransferase
MDVFVIPEYRGRGISKTLLQTILDHPDLQNLRLFLLVTRDAHGLYERFGFRPLAQPDQVMEIRDPDSDSRAQ